MFCPLIVVVVGAAVVLVFDAVVVVVAAAIVVVAVVATTVAAAATATIALPPPPKHRHSCFRCCRGARPSPRGASPAIAVAVAVIAHACRQRGASPAVAVVTCARCQGVALRRERVQSVPGRITVGVRPKSQLCEPVVTRLTQN
jgi:hypothetical protein